MGEVFYCPVCREARHKYPLALVSESIETRARLFSRKRTLVETFKPCPICNSVLKRYTIVEIDRGRGIFEVQNINCDCGDVIKLRKAVKLGTQVICRCGRRHTLCKAGGDIIVGGEIWLTK